MENEKQASGEIQSGVVSHSNPTRSSSNASATLGSPEQHPLSHKKSLETTKESLINGESDPVSIIEKAVARVESEAPDGGWRAWSVVFGVRKHLRLSFIFSNFLTLYRPLASHFPHSAMLTLGECGSSTSINVL